MKTELEIFFEEYSKSNEPYFCHHSAYFETLWVKDVTKIREKASIFLKEWDIKDVSVGRRDISPVSDGWNGVLFSGGNAHTVRVKFLEWCIEKGYETINDLFI